MSEPESDKYLIITADPFLRFNGVTGKHEVVVNETVFRYESCGEVLKDCYSNEIILDYDADDKTIFEFRLKGRTEPDFPEHPE